ncbi:MAG: methyltransferase domain-containing protein [Candidatus Saccharibacteria bacterium]|nr:methyltransferase domain-containing protein [Candidatus Saccharibacteria bacterium]
MMIYILGRQPAIGLAELESLYGSDSLRPIGNFAVVVRNDDHVDFAHIGGALKAAKILTTVNSTHLTDVKQGLEKVIVKHIQTLPDGKLKLGISTYGLNLTSQRITALGLSLKKIIKANNRSVRLVPNNENHLNSAQVLHNKLISELGCELLLIGDGVNTIIAQTTDVQDIDAYTLRDRGRPKRDARVGMLPPKLAQTIINLATTGAKSNGKRLLDPFCGTGVVLQEAALMGYQVYGTDIDERMISYSKDNLDWLAETHKVSVNTHLHVGDATETTWQQPIDIVACEGYLGRPFTSVPDNEILQKTINDCETILNIFLQNLAKQTKPGTRMCLAVPSWFVNDKKYHLRTLDHLSHLGYNRISFVHSNDKDLIYHREGQIVGRELLVLTRK